MKRGTVIAIFIAAAALIGGIGGGLMSSLVAIRLANGVLAALFVYLAWYALARDRTPSAVLFGLLALLLGFFVVKATLTAPVWDFLGEIVDAM